LPRTIDVASGAAAPSRVGWCYGDPGAGASLLWAARAVDNRQWSEAALEIIGYGAARDVRESSVVDAGFCHGAAGNAHLFNRAYQATGDPALRTAALTWLEHTLAYQEPGGRCAGFLAQEESGSVEDESLLSGIAGIGLTLLAAITSVEPQWDRLFACAIPPR
jgi:lantibiotic modifying enzyme